MSILINEIEETLKLSFVHGIPLANMIYFRNFAILDNPVDNLIDENDIVPSSF